MDKKLLEQLEQLSVPKQALHEARLKALQQKRREQKRYRRTVKTMLFLAAMLALFITSIRISPTVASAVAKIPGFEQLVDMIAYDKGVEDILQNNYFESIGASATKSNLTYTIDQVIADESGMIISYKVEGLIDPDEIKRTIIEVFQNGKPVEASYGYSLFTSEETTIIEDKIEVAASEMMDYTHRDFEVRFISGDEVTSIPFTLQQDIVKTKDYQVNKEIQIDGQKLTVKSVHISPLRVEIKFLFHSENTKRILSISSLQLLDENGEEWGKISNGITGFGSEIEGEMSYFLQSNYFRKPQALTIVISEVEALTKGEDFIEVDFEKGQLLYMPKLPLLEVTAVQKAAVDFTYIPKNPNSHIQVFGEGVDATGKKVEGRGGFSSGFEEWIEASAKYETDDITNPVKIYIYSYPVFLNGSAEVEIPLK